MQDTFSEIIKLSKIIITVTTVEMLRCFSLLNEVKSFQGYSMSQDSLNAVVLLSMEKSLV